MACRHFGKAIKTAFKLKHMFSLFKGKSELEKLNEKYKKLLEDAHRLSTSNRTLSDQKTAEANEVLSQIEALNKNS